MYRARIDSPLGPILLCADREGLRGLYFVDQKDCPPLEDGPPPRLDSLRPSSGMASGIPLRTLRPARRQMPSNPERRPAPLSIERAGPQLLQEQTSAEVLELFSRVQEELSQYFFGARREFGFSVALSGTAFQMKVWEALRRVPYGEVVSYGKLAAMAGLTAGHGRAVGAAVGRNPVSIAVPCHRIIGANRSLTGYGGGLSRKVSLLELEGFELFDTG